MNPDRRTVLQGGTAALLAGLLPATAAEPAFKITEDADRIHLVTPHLEAAFAKKKYVTGVAAQTFYDKKSGARDLGYGLDIVDWIMQPGSDAEYRDQLKGDLPYDFNNAYHGKIAKRGVEGPQICTKAGTMAPQVVRGPDFVAVKQSFTYTVAAPGKKAGSRWDQTIVFPADTRYFISSDKITSANAGDDFFLRLDLPGHIKHKDGDTFSEVYLSYHDGLIPAKEFAKSFAPDEKFRYAKGETKEPKRFIRAYHIRDPKTGKDGPWLAGMTLDPGIVTDAWCHQRGYVCMIEEFGGKPVKAGGSWSAAFIIGFFDSITEMESVYDKYAGNTGLEATESGWKLR